MDSIEKAAKLISADDVYEGQFKVNTLVAIKARRLVEDVGYRESDLVSEAARMASAIGDDTKIVVFDSALLPRSCRFEVAARLYSDELWTTPFVYIFLVPKELADRHWGNQARQINVAQSLAS
ncbi:MAG: hypothetical protein AAGF57_04725 [Pseudomonadota bacterium]